MPKNETQVVLAENKETASTAIKTFVPYKSVLTFMSPPAQAPKPVDESNNYEKKKSKPAKFPKAGKVVNPMSKQVTTKGKSAMKVEIQAKKQKAVLARKKAQARVVTTIDLDDSDESDCIPIELPPPPLISVDSSDDELAIQKRAMSPSTSSIMSDDFIFAGDKRRLENAFKSNDEVHERYEKNIAQLKENLQKAKAMIKPSSSSSSDSTRSSCERNIDQSKTTEGPQEQRKKRKSGSADRNSFDKTNEDSIYGAKASKAQKATAANKSDSSEEESPCVNVRIQNVRRRKSTGSRKKSTEGDHSEPEDPRAKLFASTPIAQASKRSRFVTPSYDDEEFASMISTIVQSTITEDFEDESNEAADEAKTVAKKTAESTVISVNDTTVEQTTMLEVPNRASEDDCEIIEQPSVVIEVPDEEELSDSDDSLRGVTLPINCDLSLNITQTPYNPHEYIRNAGETSQELSSIRFGTIADPEIGWNDEMKFFYDGSWGDENFSIASIMSAMPRDPKLWKVAPLDGHRTADNTCRLRCKKCNELGHIAARCNRPKKRVVCFMCGAEGHRETRCPNSICLRVSFGRFPSKAEIYFYFYLYTVWKAESNVLNRVLVLPQAEQAMLSAL